MAQPRRKLPPLNALRAFEVSGRRLNFRTAAEELERLRVRWRSRSARWRINSA